MHILAAYQGHYGERIVENLKKSGPKEWTVDVYRLPRALPMVVDEPEEFLPSKMPQAELLLAMNESAETAQLVPAIARLSAVKAVIMPVDNSAWLPPGLRNQIKDDLYKRGVTAVFPKTFCTLTNNTTGYKEDTEHYSDENIAAFAGYFGWPKFKIQLDGRQKIAEVKIERRAPCGSTVLVARRLIGLPITEAIPQAGLFAHHYPCLASMAMEPNGETLMHISGYVVNDEISRKIQSS